MRRAVAVAVAVGGLVSSVKAQSSTVYADGAGLICYAASNPYRMYFVKGADTASFPATENSAECQRWSKASGNFDVRIETIALDLEGRKSSSKLLVSSIGQLLSVNDVADSLTGDSDFLLHVPSRSTSLRVGMKWSDTVEYGSGPGGKRLLRLERDYRVTRQLDTLGQRVAEIVAAGTVRYRDAWQNGSTRGTPAWLDVTGPVQEHYFYSPKLKRIVAREWTMDLTGSGGLRGLPGDTLQAGLSSSERTAMITEERFLAFGRTMPGMDTSYTVRAEPFALYFLHTIDRTTPGALLSGMRRADGMMGTATATYAGDTLTKYEVLWTDVAEATRQIDIEVQDRSLLVRGPTPETVPIPPNPWGVADYAMSEQLIPALLALPRDSTVTFSIYRPYPAHWDHYRTRLEVLGSGLLATLQDTSSRGPVLIVISTDGQLLFSENSDPTGAIRLLPRNDPRRAEADRLRALLANRKRA